MREEVRACRSSIYSARLPTGRADRALTASTTTCAPPRHGDRPRWAERFGATKPAASWRARR